MGYLLRKSVNSDWKQLKGKHMLQSTKLKIVGDLKRVLPLDIQMQTLEFVHLLFSLGLVQYFLSVFLPLNFGTVRFILCLGILEVCGGLNILGL